MRSILIALVLLFVVSSIASAELLSTAMPLGQGKWGVLGAGIRDMNHSNTSDWYLTTYGGYVGYGLTDKLDAYLQLGSATAGGLPAGLEMSGILYAISLKYTVLEEGNNMPVSVSVGAGYRSGSRREKIITETNFNDTQIMAGVGVSKVFAPFIPYGAIAYRSNSTNGNDAGTQLDITLGSAIAWSTQGAVYVEYTSQSITPKPAGNNYTSGQIALGVGYII